MMPNTSKNPRILMVTPELSYVPVGMAIHANCLSAKAGGMADVTAGLIQALYQEGADIHVAIPDYRAIFNGQVPQSVRKNQYALQKYMPEDRIHFTKDRAFFYRHQIYSGKADEDLKNSLVFQREVINNVISYVQPDLIHCNDWMTGLIPAMARKAGIPCLFTLHNIHTVKSTLAEIEDRGIDAAAFWQHLFYESFPSTYEQTRDAVPVDLITSGVFASHFVNTVSPTFLEEIIQGRHGIANDFLKQELAGKKAAGTAFGILNSPDPSYNPSTDDAVVVNYTAKNHVFGKKSNKRILQQRLGLVQDLHAPIFFWPSRLDPFQKGCQLLTEILYKVVSAYWDQNLEIVFIADGEYQRYFQDIVGFHDLYDRVAVCNFNERLARQAYAASDFVLMPSSFEPCGLPQMIGAIYGALPIVHDTGGLHDTVVHLDAAKNTGNGFVFKNFDPQGLFRAIDQAMAFHRMPPAKKARQIRRIMKQSAAAFNHQVTAQTYIDLYERMLRRPLFNFDAVKSKSHSFVMLN